MQRRRYFIDSERDFTISELFKHRLGIPLGLGGSLYGIFVRIFAALWPDMGQEGLVSIRIFRFRSAAPTLTGAKSGSSIIS